MSNPFKKPDKPKSALESLKWVIFEPVLLKNFSETLNKKQTILLFLRAYLWIILFSLILYIIGAFTVVILDFPTLFPNEYKADFIAQWQNYTDFPSKLYFFISYKNFVGLRFLAAGLAITLAVSLVYALITLEGSLRIGSSMSVLFALLFGSITGLESSGSDLIFSLAIGLSFGLIFGSVISLPFGLGFGLAYSLGFGLAYGLSNGLTSGLSLYFAYFRFIFYPFHFIKNFLKVDFEHNPYLNDGIIWLPIVGVKSKLTQLAQKEPDTALKFVNFLLEYRPLQRSLAMHITHSATAGRWSQNSLNADKLLLPAIAEDYVFDETKFSTPATLKPSEKWTEQCTALKKQLISAQTQSSITLKKENFQQFIKQLADFKQQTLLESPSWNRYYFSAIDKWQTVAAEEMQKIQQEAENREPMAPNVYRFGDALRPETDCDVFMGRDDLKDALATEILTSPNMPLFLIQGQRRVGKTSLLNFLPKLLGSRFKIVYQDCQDARVSSVTAWMQDLRQRIEKSLNLPKTDWQPPENWLAAWQEMQEYLHTISQEKDDKIILAIDEYEVLHDYFQDDEKTAKRLLGALRSFSQQQNQVVFLFVGAALFSELHAPNWSEYFVQVRRFKVDYLEKADAIRLMTEPVDLKYPPNFTERLFYVTQGHPALLQLICKKIVDIANRELRRTMTLDDLERCIDEITHEKETGAINVFWTQFCDSKTNQHCRETVQQILNNQTPTHKPSLLRLAEHGFIIKQDNTWTLRVPLFQMWLTEFMEAFE